ncbi:aminoglycoside phosphotransferase family protein [Rhodovibrionaceae bacterium A322]
MTPAQANAKSLLSADRQSEIDTFLAESGWADASWDLLAADASFRRYHRAVVQDKAVVIMDAPPGKEKPEEFVHLSNLLTSLDLSPPAILNSDLPRGLVLLEDLGDDTFTKVLRRAQTDNQELACAGQLYKLASDTLIQLHSRWETPLAKGIPAYDEQVLLEEALLFTDWLWPVLFGAAPKREVRDSFIAAWKEVLPVAQALPSTLVLRDYHVDNLMVLNSSAGTDSLLDRELSVADCGLLDFQDALIGSPAYDLVSLLRDARRDVEQDLQDSMMAHYLSQRPGLDEALFKQAYWVLGAQRTTKILGIFMRLWKRDGKAAYLRHFPRLWRLLGEELSQPCLAPVAAWFEAHVPDSKRIQPESTP